MSSDFQSGPGSETAFERIAELLIETREDDFSEGQRQELNDLLRASEENREFAARFLQDGAALKESLAADQMKALATGSPLKPSPSVACRPRFWRRPSTAWLAAAATVILTAAVSYLLFAPRDTPAPEPEPNQGPIAVLGDAAAAVFADGAEPLDGVFESKPYSLVEGMVVVKFRNRVAMTVSAPADFEIVDELRVKLNKGRVRAYAPPSGSGFTVATPSNEVRDLGTDFGVSVDPQSGADEILVFDGKVDIRTSDAPMKSVPLRAGEAVRIDKNGEIDTEPEIDRAAFLAPPDVAFSRWKRHSETLRQDPSLVLYYTFSDLGDGDPVQDRGIDLHTALNQAVHGPQASQAVGSGPRRVAGRWPGKEALLFDSPNDQLYLNYDKKVQQLTFAAWFKFERFDTPVTTLFSSRRASKDAIRLTVQRDDMSFLPMFNETTPEKAEARLVLGRWIHLAAVYDLKAKTATTYIDGEVAGSAELPGRPSSIQKLGKMMIGSGVRGNGSHGQFGGRTDEVALWKRALSQQEIKQLYADGRQELEKTVAATQSSKEAPRIQVLLPGGQVAPVDRVFFPGQNQPGGKNQPEEAKPR